MPILFKVVTGIVFFIYPIIVYFGLMHFALWQIAVLLVILSGVRLIIFREHTTQMAKVGFYGAMALLFFSIFSAVLKQSNWLKLYPILMSLMLFSVFFQSLFTEKSMIQKFAEIKEKNIDGFKQQYMRKLTIVWCIFFIVNAGISAYTLVYLSLSQWTVYNGLLSYILIGTIIVVEYIYRHVIVLKRYK